MSDECGCTLHHRSLRGVKIPLNRIGCSCEPGCWAERSYTGPRVKPVPRVRTIVRKEPVDG